MKPLAVTVLALVASLGAVDSLCLKGWTSYENNCYRAYDVTVSWGSAIDICKSEETGADLVTINNFYENAFLIKEFGEKRHWIGLNDRDNEGTYIWSNGDTASYRNWDCCNSEPDGLTSDNCVHINSYVNGGWSDISCTSTYPFICEMAGL